MKISSRQTGRTSRMIEDAISKIKDGKTVYIIAANAREQRRLGELVRNHLEVKVENPDSFGNFSWKTLRLRGADPDCVVFIDHLTIETKFSGILSILHRYDKMSPSWNEEL